MQHSTVPILGIPVTPYTHTELLQSLQKHFSTTKQGQETQRFLVTINPEILMRAHSDSAYRNIICTADACIPDGTGIVWALRLLYGIKTKRLPGVNLVQTLAKFASEQGKSIFLLGAAPGRAANAAQHLQNTFPQLRILGTYPGTPTQGVTTLPTQIQQQLNQADFVFVAYGAPAQDQWLAENRQHLAPHAVLMGVGGTFDFLSGAIPRAPRWMQHLGLEWLFRLIHEPWRWRRMLALPHFALAVLWEKVTIKESPPKSIFPT